MDLVLGLCPTSLADLDLIGFPALARSGCRAESGRGRWRNRRTVVAADRRGRAESELAGGVMPGGTVERHDDSWGRGRSVVLPWFVEAKELSNSSKVGGRCGATYTGDTNGLEKMDDPLEEDPMWWYGEVRTRRR